MKTGMNNLWSTPFLYEKFSDDDFNQSILNFCLNQNQTNIFEQNDKEIQKFRDKIVVPSYEKFLNESLNKSLYDWSSYKLDSWIVRYGNSKSMPFHNHKGSQLSMVYYVLAEKREDGSIYFNDPRTNANRGYDLKFLPWFEQLKISVESQDLVVFPSFLYHFVSTYFGNIRIAIVTDLFLFDDV